MTPEAEPRTPLMDAELLEQEGQEQRADPQTVCGALQREANWKCLILTLLIAGCLGAVTWCRLTEVTKVIINFSVYPIKSTRQMSPCDDGYIYIPVAFMAMLYLVYLVECWHCTARIQLTYRADISGVLETVAQMREAQPVVWWKALCYHYVRRKRQVTRYRHGDAYTTSQVYYERVNSHAAGARFHHTYCGVRDISKVLTLDVRGPITKIRFSKGFAFANMAAAAEFEEQRARFFAEHERYDDYMEMREGLDLAGVTTFKEFVVAYADPVNRPWYSGSKVFWLASCVLLSWPLRMVLQYNTAHVHYQITKLFGVNYTTRPTTTPQLHVSHGSTIDSDLEGCIRDNLSLIPSYSEALLMDQRNNADSTTEPLPPSYSSYTVRAGSRTPELDQGIPEPEPDTIEQEPNLLEQQSDISEQEPMIPECDMVLGRNRRSWGGLFTSRPSLLSRSTTQYRLVNNTSENSRHRRSLGNGISRTSLASCLGNNNSQTSLGAGCLGNSHSRTSLGVGSERDTTRRSSLGACRSSSGNTPSSLVLFYPSPLLEHCPSDPFQGRSVTTPTEDPPPYEDALRLPVLSRLRRSLTERGEVGGRRGEDDVEHIRVHRAANITMETSL